MNQRDSDMDEEMREHVRLLTERNLAAGMSPTQARRAARLRFGPDEAFKEECRDGRLATWLGQIAQDLRYAVRMLRRSPGFTVAVVVTLALGLGANAAIFSLVNAVLLRSLPVADPERLVLLFPGDHQGRWSGPPGPGSLASHSFPLYQRLRGQNAVFEDLAAEKNNDSGASVQGLGAFDSGSTERALVKLVTTNYFRVLGVSAYRGRAFLPDEGNRDAATAELVLSHGYWQRRFGADPAAIGAKLLVNGAVYTVVGVTPPGFSGAKIGVAVDFWIPMGMQPQFMSSASLLTQRNTWWLRVYGRLKPGASLEAARASVNVTFQQFLSEDPGSPQDLRTRAQARIAVTPGAKGVFGLQRSFRQPLLFLLTGAGLLLLIACLNVSHLLYGRALRRRSEMSLRLALGAGRARLVRQLVTEGLLLALLGTTGGLILMKWLSAGLLQLAASGAEPLVLDVAADARVMGFTALLALVTTVLLGLLPAWQTLGRQLDPALRASARSIAGGGLAARLPLIFQVTLSLVLLAGAHLLARSLVLLRSQDKGFDEQHLLLVELMNPRLTGLTMAQMPALYQNLVERTAALPGVRSASLSDNVVLSGNGSTSELSVPGQTQPPGEAAEVELGAVTPQYFITVGMRFAYGRSFTAADREGPKVAVVNQTLAQRFFGVANATGKRFRLTGSPEEIEVVGVVQDGKVRSLREPQRPKVYQPVAQAPDFLRGLELRTFGDPVALAEQVRRAIHEVNPGLVVVKVMSMRSQIDRNLWKERLVATLATGFGLVALFLVCVGMYAVITQWTAQRTSEIGVRMALGATAFSVTWMVLRQALAVVGVGIALGVPAALATSQLLRAFLFGLSPADPSAFVLAPLAILGVATLAAYLPARRAARLAPLLALRHE